MNREDVKCLTMPRQNDVAIRDQKSCLLKMWHNANLSLNVAFVRKDPHATSTSGWRLIIFPCGMPACVNPRETSHSPKGSLRGALYNRAKSCLFRPAGRFRAGLARPISTPVGSADGESTENPPPASFALALAPWPARRPLKVEKIESISRVAAPAPRCRASYVKPGLQGSHPRKKKFSQSYTVSL